MAETKYEAFIHSFFVGVIPIACGINISTLANMVVIIVAVCAMILNLDLRMVPKLVPNEWANSKFKVSKTWSTVITVLTMFTEALTVVLQLIKRKESFPQKRRSRFPSRAPATGTFQVSGKTLSQVDRHQPLLLLYL